MATSAAEMSYVVGYARVNSSVFSLALKVLRVLAVLVFTVSWFQTVGAATQKWAHMVDIEYELWRNVMPW